MDESGSIDMKEFREALHCLYPHLASEKGGEREREVLAGVRTTCADVSTGQLDLPAFLDALRVVASMRVAHPITVSGEGQDGANQDIVVSRVVKSWRSHVPRASSWA